MSWFDDENGAGGEEKAPAKTKQKPKPKQTELAELMQKKAEHVKAWEDHRAEYGLSAAPTFLSRAEQATYDTLVTIPLEEEIAPAVRELRASLENKTVKELDEIFKADGVAPTAKLKADRVKEYFTAMGAL